MSAIYSVSAFVGFVVLVACVTRYDPRNFKISPFVILIAAAAAARFALFKVSYAYENDLNCFKAWADMLYRNGMSKFYVSDGYTDYPPGYMYVLYIIGALQSKLNLSGGAYDALIKLPSVICDLVITGVIFTLARRKFSEKTAFFLGLAYALNPAALLDSSVWPQVDAVHTMLLLLSINWLADKKYRRSFILYAVAVLVKPQSLIAAPVFIYAVFAALYKKPRAERNKALLELATSFGIALWAAFLICLPFATGFLDFRPIFRQYLNTLGSYPYATLNSYNLYGFLGANWTSVTNSFLGMTYDDWGFIFIDVIVFASLFFMDRGKGKKSSYFVVTGMLYVLTFMLSVKMHERYIMPALVFFLAAYIFKPDKKLLLFYGGFSITAFVNCIDVLYVFRHENASSYLEQQMRFVSLVNIVLTAAMLVGVYLMYGKNGQTERESDIARVPFYEKRGPVVFERTAPSAAITRRDVILMCVLTALYASIAFINLGNIHSPQTAWAPQYGDAAVLELLPEAGSSGRAASFAYMPGARNEKWFSIESSSDGENWHAPGGDDRLIYEGDPPNDNEIPEGMPGLRVRTGGVFRWAYADVDFTDRFVRITSFDSDTNFSLMMQEIAFRDAVGNPIPMRAVSGTDAANLADERQWVPERSSYMNSTYFDEIYHARTGYEFLHGLQIYENTHPPLGKVLISAGIAMFGMTPFGWRFMGTLIGVLMVPLIYVFAKRLFRKTEWALFTSFIFTFDFMHFAQTRISTIDSYVTFFVMGMYLFMYEYYRINFFDTGQNLDGDNPKNADRAFKKSLLTLALCGLFMGFAVASKWQGVYGAVGLPVLLFYTLFKRYREYMYAKNRKNADIPFDKVRKFPKYLAITAAVCVGVFIVLPGAIYCLSYIPYLAGKGITGFSDGIKEILANQSGMFNYHSGVDQAHPYSSHWYEWPVMIKPIFYYVGSAGAGLTEGISSFGNPALWWTGIAATLYAFGRQARKFSKVILFLLIGYAAQYLPWILIGRTTFIYHYFPSVPFIAFLVTYFFKDYVAPRKPKLVFWYAVLVFGLFVAFYPVIAAYPTSWAYVNFLKFMPWWTLA